MMTIQEVVDKMVEEVVTELKQFPVEERSDLWADTWLGCSGELETVITQMIEEKLGHKINN